MKRIGQFILRPVLWLGEVYSALIFWLMRGEHKELQAKGTRHERFKAVREALIKRLGRSSLMAQAYQPMMIDRAYEEKLISAVNRLQPIVYADGSAIVQREAQIEWIAEEVKTLLAERQPHDKIAARRLSARIDRVLRDIDELEMLLS